MTTLSTLPDLVDDVVRLLADRVRSDVLDRVVLEILEGDGTAADDELSALLESGSVSAALRQDFAAGCWLLGFRTSQPAQLLSRAHLAADAYRVLLRTTRHGATLWALVPASGRRWIDDVLVDQELPEHLALLRQVPDLRLTPSLRIALDSLLDLGLRRGWSGLADADRLDAARRVEALLDLAASHPELVSGPLDALVDNPTHNTLAETLLVWLTHGRDTAAAAQHLHLHVNTLRYRLRRAQELAGVDLSDQDQRLLAEVQLRLWGAARDRR